jgi:hypothetical protein
MLGLSLKFGVQTPLALRAELNAILNRFYVKL